MITQLNRLRCKQSALYLDNINKFLNWKPIRKLLNQKFKKNYSSVGNPAYSFIKMFKVLLLQSLYNLSDREMDEALFDRISFRKFAGFFLKDYTPSYSTICRFRNRLIQLGLDKELFKIINDFLVSNKLIFKKGAIVDASIIKSSRRPRKTIAISTTGPEVVYLDDFEDKWTTKAGKPHYGYKLHISTDSRYGFIIGGHITSANRSDTKEFFKVLNEMKLEKDTLVLADKGYASMENRNQLMLLGFRDGIMHKATSRKALTLLQKKINSEISSVRGIVERTFGTLKENYSLHRAKYLGVLKTKGQFLLSAIAFNLKKASAFVR